MRLSCLLLFFLLLHPFTHGQTTRFAHVTDTHVGGQSGADDLLATVKDINRQVEIDFVLFTGDITEFGSDAELREARKIIDRLNKPWHILPGNHDSKWSESGNNSFATILGEEHFSFIKNGYLFIGTASGPNMRMGPGLVPRKQIVFLDSVLRNRQTPDQPVIFVNHYPLDESLANWYTVTDLLKTANIRATLLGHGHANKLFNFEGIQGVMGRSNLKTPKTGSGYNIVTLKKDTMYYAERLSSGITLPVWCKVPLNSTIPATHAVQRPDFSVNRSFPGIGISWVIEENSDIGTGVSLEKGIAVYATAKGDIKAANSRTGEILWAFHTGGKVYSTPAISNKRVVCASTDGNIYCLDVRSGSLVWKFATAKPVVACPAAADNRVYIGSSEGVFRCLDLQSGKLLWQFDSIRNFVESRPLVLGKSVCFGSWGNAFYSLYKSSGKLLWKREKYSNRMLSPAAVWPVAANGKIFIVAPDRHMTALDELTGKEVWDSGKFSCRESIGISGDGSLVYIKNMTEGNIDAFYTNAPEQMLAWECKADLGYEIGPSPLVENGKYLFVPTATGMVIAIDRKTHSVAWKYKVSHALINSVLPVGKHQILVSSMDGKIVSLEIP